MAEGRGERTIGSGHLVALFLGIVVLCCVFFILGYEMGRAQFEHGGAAASAAKPAASAPTPAKPETPAPGWPSGTPSGAPESAKPAATAASSAPAAGKPAAAAPSQPAATHNGSAAGLKAPEIPRGSLVLQVAANRSESEALGLAKILQEKGFPAFVLTPTTDQWYRVQVGPYADAKSAEQAKAALAKVGFNAIVKH
jgi:cell division septation protein DedD